MRCGRMRRTPAHKTDYFGELVCSNSLKSEQREFGALAAEAGDAALGSMLMRAADAARVPGGHALTVDRERFSQSITEAIERSPAY